jgi:hypothetical protein
MKKAELQEKLQKLEMAYNYLSKQYHDLKDELQQYKNSEVISKIEYENLKKQYDNIYRFKSMYYDLVDDMQKLRQDYHLYCSEIKNEHKKDLKNPFNAGRKPVLSDSQKMKIKEESKAGKTIRLLAKDYGVSVGTIHNVIKNKSKYE